MDAREPGGGLGVLDAMREPNPKWKAWRVEVDGFTPGYCPGRTRSEVKGYLAGILREFWGMGGKEPYLAIRSVVRAPEFDRWAREQSFKSCNALSEAPEMPGR